VKKPDSIQSPDKVGAHLNRIKGQVEGIAKMYQEGKEIALRLSNKWPPLVMRLVA